MTQYLFLFAPSSMIFLKKVSLRILKYLEKQIHTFLKTLKNIAFSLSNHRLRYN